MKEDSRYTTHIRWDEKNQEFIATCDEFPFLSGIDEDMGKAMEILEKAIAGSLVLAKEQAANTIFHIKQKKGK